MKNVISTIKGPYEFETIKLYLGRKLIDREIAKTNLLDFKKVLDKNNIKFGLMYGTLLGAIRENNFIEHDEDVDIFMLDEDRKNFMNILFDLRKVGLNVVRYESDLLSVMRDNEYIDIYFFKRTFNKKRRERDFELDAGFLENTEYFEFLGEQFLVPSNPKELLVFLYGEDWMIPQKDKKPELNTIDRKIKNYIIRKVPIAHKIYQYIIK